MIAAHPRSWQQISIRAVAGFVGLLEHTTAALRNPWHDISKLAITPPQAPETISMIAAHPRSWQQISIRAVAGFDELLEHTTAALRNPWHDISKLAIIPPQAPETISMIATYPSSWQQISIRAVAGFDELLDHATAALRNPRHDISKLAIIPHQAPEILGMIAAYHRLCQKI